MTLYESFKSYTGLTKTGLDKRKISTFGDTSAVGKGRFWSVLSVLTLAIIWYLGSAFGLINPIFWPSPSAVWQQFSLISEEGYRNFSLWEHIWASLYRILVGFTLGCLIGIPLGFAMGLSQIIRGWFDPIVEFFRPIPPLAFIPLVIIWSGIGERSKILLLFFAALWIMVIAARAGVSSVKLNKIHAAHSLGANKRQILRYVILPNSLPEIFTGMRVAMGVCWGTVVAAELVAAESGVGFMIMVASKFLATDIVVLGVIIVGLIGYGIDIMMRKIEAKLIPWKGKA
ncbi:ABC transporter permease [Marinomonas sp. 2405UD68-3]|uniref:ABC transporter permease n=1 Tax=Marinomonas sp. 2405UD68-3 TaxID=3391835 RepID=UPI0039C9EF6D